MSDPLVSIIIPLYNSGEYIEETIASAIDQTWPNKEIIVIDDGSTDNSLAIARRFEAPNIKIIQQENRGASTARNKGLSIAKGQYIQFLDADDLLSPDKIEAQVLLLNSSINNLAICKTVHFNNGYDHLSGTMEQAWFYKDSADPVDFLTKLYAGDEVMPGYGGMITIHAWLTPRALIDKAGQWNEKLSVDDDGEFFCRVVLASAGIRFSDIGLNFYRKFTSNRSLSAQRSKKNWESMLLAIDLKYSHLKAKTNDKIINRIFAKHYWWAGVLAYPQFKDISKHFIQTAKQLGYSGEKYIGGPLGHFLARFLGWKAARYFSHYQQQLKANK